MSAPALIQLPMAAPWADHAVEQSGRAVVGMQTHGGTLTLLMAAYRDYAGDAEVMAMSHDYAWAVRAAPEAAGRDLFRALTNWREGVEA